MRYIMIAHTTVIQFCVIYCDCASQNAINNAASIEPRASHSSRVGTLRSLLSYQLSCQQHRSSAVAPPGPMYNARTVSICGRVSDSRGVIGHWFDQRRIASSICVTAASACLSRRCTADVLDVCDRIGTGMV